MNLRKFGTIVMSSCMSLAMATMPALAAEPNANANRNDANYNITINNNKAGHTYEAYKLMEGDLHTVDGALMLTNIEWADGIVPTKLQAPYNGMTAKAVAKELAGNAVQNVASDKAAQFAQQVVKDGALGTVAKTTNVQTNGKYVLDKLTPGYYLVRDKKDSLKGKYDADTTFILRVVGSTEATPKSDVPSVTKKVEDMNDTTDSAFRASLDATWADTADYDIGDEIPYLLTATMPSDEDKEVDKVKPFSAYTTYSLTYHDTVANGISVADVTDADVYINNEKLTEEQKTAIGFTVEKTAKGVDFKIVDIKKATKTVGGNAEQMVKAGDQVKVIYKAKLTDQAVFGNAKNGNKGNDNTVYLEYRNNPNVDGSGDTGNTPEDTVRVFTYLINVTKVDQNEAALAGAEFKLEKKLANGDFKTIVGSIALKADSANVFEMKGLDDGTYRITETRTPKGYNSIKPITFTVNATHSADPATLEVTDFNVSGVTQEAMIGDTTNDVPTFTATKDNGLVATTIKNEKGLVLPITGDIGTTLFYLAGIALIGGAAVYFKRKKSQLN